MVPSVDIVVVYVDRGGPIINMGLPKSFSNGVLRLINPYRGFECRQSGFL